MKTKSNLEKLWDLPYYLNFIIGTVFTGLIWAAVLPLLTDEGYNFFLTHALRAGIGVTIISMIFGGMWTLMIYTVNESDKIYTAINAFKPRIDAEMDIDKLIDIHEEMRAYYKEKIGLRHHGDAFRKVYFPLVTKIETLKKLKENEKNV